MARALRVPVSAVAERRGFARSDAPQCVFSARGAVVSVAVSGAPQAYAVLMRGAEEQAQIFGAKRFVPAPQEIFGEGVGSYWFPAAHQVMATEGVNLVTTTVVRWPGVPRARLKRAAGAITRPYLGPPSRKTLRGPAP